ncbi:MAG: AsmA-like C-terminal region-containing protein [Kiritimatiellia bacterium]|jgi:hypothetical protein
MKPGAKPKRLRFRTIHIVGALVLVAIAFLLRLASQGLPPSWVDALAARASTDRFALELEGVSVSLRRIELDVSRIRIYPRGVVHEAILELQDSFIALRPRRGRHPLSWIRSIRIGRLALPASSLDMGAQATTSFAPPQSTAAPDERTPAHPRPGRSFDPIHLDCASVEGFGLVVNNVALSASVTNDTLHLGDVRLSLPSRGPVVQKLTGRLDFDFNPRRLAIEAGGRLDAARLVPLFRAIDLPGLASEIALIGFPGVPPDIQLRLDYRPADGVRDLRIDVKAGYCTYNGVPLTSVAGVVRASGANHWNDLDIAPLHACRPEGEARGGLTIDLDRDTLAFEADSTLDPLHLLRLARVTSEPVLLPLGFDNPTRVVASGVYDLSRHPHRTDIRGVVSSPCITAQGVQFVEASAHARLRDEIWSLTNVAAQVCGGRLDATAAFTPHLKRPAYFDFTCEGRFSDLRYEQWGTLLNPEADHAGSPGTLDLAFAIRGRLPPPEDDILKSLAGDGRLEMEDVRVYTIPLFAGLTAFLADSVPGVDFLLSQDDLEANWTYADERLDLEDLRISGNVFSASAVGSIGTDGQLDLLLKGHLLNRGTWLGQGLYYALFPISKMLEFRATGHWNAPDWRPVNLPGGKSPERKP